MKLNEKRIKLLKEKKIEIDNRKKDRILLNQILTKALNKDINIPGAYKYYFIEKNYKIGTDYILNSIKEFKPISWFFEEEINNILLLI